MTTREEACLRENLKKGESYLEFGAGASTKMAVDTPNLSRIYSVDSSPSFVETNLLSDRKVSAAIAANRLRFHLVNIGPTKKWGYPEGETHRHLWPNYPLSIFNTLASADIVLIDGRFRIACTLATCLCIPCVETILIHDYWNRTGYHILSAFLDTLHRVDSFGVFRPKPGLDLVQLQCLIEQFQYQPHH